MMPDIEKVIKGLKQCRPHAYSGMNCEECPYRKPSLSERKECDCVRELHNDVLNLLKWQEAVEPIYIENPYTHLPVSYCPKCREPISMFITGNPYRKTKYCHYCGQEINWNE